MDMGIFVILMLTLWLGLRLNRKSKENITKQRPTLEVLTSIENKLDVLISAQSKKVNHNSKDINK